MATNPTYQSNSTQNCSCPSGGASITTPSCCQKASGNYYGVQNWQHVVSNAYPSNYTSQMDVCAAVAAREAANGYPQFSNLTWNGVGCYDGNSGDAVNGYPAYPYFTGTWSQDVCQ
jgi:hypothetical protein